MGTLAFSRLRGGESVFGECVKWCGMRRSDEKVMSAQMASNKHTCSS